MAGITGAELDIPDEILSILPKDPYEKLDLARKITSMAIASRVSGLESEASGLREKMREKDCLVSQLLNKLKIYEDSDSRLKTVLDDNMREDCLVSQLQNKFKIYEDADSRLKTVLDDNTNLSKERDELTATVKKLTRDLAKLETFKRQLMQSLNDDNSALSETVDIGTYDQSVPKSRPSKAGEGKGRPPLQSLSGDSAQSSYSTNNVSKKTTQNCQTSNKTPKLTPTGTPKTVSRKVSPKRYSVACTPKGVSRRTSPKKASSKVSPKRHSVVGSPKGISRKASPTKIDYERHGSLSSWCPSSQQSSVANSPTRGHALPARTPKPDGKELFHQARSRLSYEQFSAFLANIKELNAHKQSREDTLRKAEEIFGRDNNDLYIMFQGLLSRAVR